ncbi:MAG TPA: GMC family oxidoreductase [Solirubrobacteraceae bacterium]|nr:GMC family oxidoreductase [Solirubrobacteraceae bacterium]
MTFPERRLRGLLIAHAIWSAILAVGYLVGGDTGTLAFMANSFAKDVLFVTLSAIGAADVRRFGAAAVVIAIGYVALVGGQIATLAWGGAPGQDVLGLFTVSGTAALLGWMAVDLLLAAWFSAWWVAAVRAGRGLRYLHPVAFLSLVAIAEVMIEGRREVVPPEEVARNVDDYLAELKARDKARVQLALVALGLWPLLTLRPPLPVLAPATRKRYLEKRFLDEVAERRVFRPLRPIVQVLIRTGAQMSYLGYYGDRRAWADIGYTPFAKREPNGRPARPDDPPEPPLRTLTVPPRDAHYDTVIVGSGAAGSVLAYRFAETGRNVLVLERGPHVDPRRFTDDEVEQYLRLYNEGALELATNFSLQVLQGMCVGGGTTVNNALCLAPPAPVLDRWAQHGVDRHALEHAIGEVRAWLDVTPIRVETTTEAAQRFKRAVEDLRLPGHFEVMEANITDRCLGSGYCNIGCPYGGKQAALDVLLPLAQRRWQLDVLADVEVDRIARRGDRVAGVTGVHASGARLSVTADEVVIAAGPIGSSYLLQRSGIGGDAVGHGLHFNINSPLTCEFEDVVDSFAGIQMSHAYVAPGDPPGYLVETWFNPPATQALAMPGWFHRHFQNMSRYRHMACAGVLVGTTTPGRVKAASNGPEVEYAVSDADRASMRDGLKVAGRIWLQAGATRVMPATFAWQEYRTPQELAGIDGAVRETGDLLMSSAHPQGGNPIGTVVDADFRVNGFKNLYLCDASVFPSSVHVNPQLTVMGMAQYAARRIVGEPPMTVTQRAFPHVPSS